MFIRKEELRKHGGGQQYRKNSRREVQSSQYMGSIRNEVEFVHIKESKYKRSHMLHELKRLLSSVSSTVLADRLLELEREGLISKRIYPEIRQKLNTFLLLRLENLRGSKRVSKVGY